MAPDPPSATTSLESPRIGLVTAHRDRRVWQQARALLAAGWRAEVFPARDLETLHVPDDLPRFAARREGHVEAAGRRTRTRLYALATRLGVRWAAPVYQSLRARFRPLAEGIAAKHRERLLAAHYDLVIAHDPPTLPLCAAVAAETRAQVVYDSHELYPEQALLSSYARRYWSQVEMAYIGSAALVVTVSQGIAEELARRHRLARLPFVLPNVCHYRPRPQRPGRLAELYRLPEGKPIVLCQGGLMPRRGLETVVEAWHHIPPPRPLLVFLGEGPLVEWVQQRAKSRGLAGTVFVGRAVGENELLDYTAGADLGLIPYAQSEVTPLNTRLSSPNRLFEYLMARLPVLASDLPEIRRVLDESRTGICATWKTAAELASHVQQALSWRSSISAEALEAAAQRFSFQHYEPQWLAAVAAAAQGEP